MSHVRTIAVAAALATASLFGAATAHAGFTSVSPTPYGDERDIAEILQHVYGDSVTATRVDDNDDSLWSGVVTSIKALARFAGNGQNFGTFDGTTFTSLMNTSGTGYNIAGEVSGPIALVDGTAFARQGGGSTVSTNAAYNSDGRDHAVTYQLSGDAFTTPTYVLFFEDLIGGGDNDFNDLAVQLTFAAAPGNPVAVPLPGAALMGIATLVGGVMARKRIVKSIA
jgi:hypothetical protein